MFFSFGRKVKQVARKPKATGKKSRVNIYLFYLICLGLSTTESHQKLKKQKLQEKLMSQCEDNKYITEKQPDKIKLISKDEHVFSSFIRQCSSDACKKMPKDPEQAVVTLMHIYDKFSKSPRKNYFLRKLFNPKIPNDSSKIGEYLFKMGKHKARKDEEKLKQTIQQLKQKFSSLWKECSSINCSWTKFIGSQDWQSQSRQSIILRKITQLGPN